MDEPLTQVAGWYQEHGPGILRYLRGLAGAEAAEDLLQETFVQALRGVDRVSRAASPRAWLFAIARNVGVASLRRKRRLSSLSPETVSTVERPEDPRVDRMRQAVAKLPDGQREALELRLRDGLSYEEIAVVLGIPPGTVRSRLHHAIRRLREIVATTREETADGR